MRRCHLSKTKIKKTYTYELSVLSEQPKGTNMLEWPLSSQKCLSSFMPFFLKLVSPTRVTMHNVCHMEHSWTHLHVSVPLQKKKNQWVTLPVGLQNHGLVRQLWDLVFSAHPWKSLTLIASLWSHIVFYGKFNSPKISFLIANLCHSTGLATVTSTLASDYGSFLSSPGVP